MHSLRSGTQSGMAASRILSIQVGLPKVLRHDVDLGDAEREWSSGIFKEPVSGPIYLGLENLEGDGQADLAHHGGGDRATLMFSKLHYPEWEKDLGKTLRFGSFGENLTVDAITEDDVCLGDIWETVNVRLEVSQPRLPCYKLSRRVGVDGFHLKVMDARAGGWYCRTLKPGLIGAGETLHLVERPHPEWTIRRGFREFVFDKNNLEAMQALGTLPALSQLWRDRISARLEKLQVDC